MTESVSKIDSKKDKIKSWLNNKYNLTFLGLLIFIIIFRLYYFVITKNQPLWWDEAEYLSTAKSLAGINHFDFKWTLNRFPGFPLLVSLFYMIGISNEVVLRFLVAFIPSILALVLMYFVIISMYSDKKIALISLAIFSLLWEHVFYSNRFHTENWSLIFEFLAIIVLFKVYLKKEDWGFIKHKHSLFWISLLIFFCVFFRSGNLFLIPIIILFLIITNFYKIPEKLRKASAIGLIILAIAGYISLDFLSRRSTFVSQFYQYMVPIDWTVTSIFYGFYQSFIPYLPSILFYAFLIGIIIVIGRIVIFPEGFKKVNLNLQDNSYKADIFNLILIGGCLFFFIFILRSRGFEYRWFFAILPAIFALTAKGLIKFGDFIQSLLKIKNLSLIIIILLVFLGVYTQFNHTDMIVKYKLDSYSQVRDSGLWLRENSNANDLIISASTTQHTYYSERNISPFYLDDSNENESAFDISIAKLKPRFIIISGFEPAFTPSWAYGWPEKHSDRVKPVSVYYDSQNTQQPILVIYEINS